MVINFFLVRPYYSVAEDALTSQVQYLTRSHNDPSSGSVVFRLDASLHIGTGHLIRCLVLSEYLRAKNIACLFIMRRLSGEFHRLALERNHQLALLTAPDGPEGLEGQLSVSWQQDVEETRAALQGTFSRPDWLVVDHYAIDARWHRSIRADVDAIFCIDDLASRPADCDLLLDQNYFAAGESRYDGLVPRTCERLIGPQYALLAPAYAGVRTTLRPRTSPPQRVLVYFGGADLEDRSSQALIALCAPGLQQLEVDVVVGGRYAWRNRLEEQAKARGRATVHGPQPDLAAFMAAADLAIGACGVTTWERMVLGLPSVVLPIADNQKPISRELEAAGLVSLVESASDNIITAFESTIADQVKRLTDGTAPVSIGTNICDGLGTHRVANRMLQKVATT